MTKKTAVFNSTGKLKRILIGKPKYNEVMPLSDVARDLHDKGISFDRETQYRQHAEMEDVFNQVGVEISWVKLDHKLP